MTKITTNSKIKKLTPAEAGRMGGLKTLKKYGKKHFKKIAPLGGKATLKKYGKKHMARLSHIRNYK